MCAWHSLPGCGRCVHCNADVSGAGGAGIEVREAGCLEAQVPAFKIPDQEGRVMVNLGRGDVLAAGGGAQAGTWLSAQRLRRPRRRMPGAGCPGREVTFRRRRSRLRACTPMPGWRFMNDRAKVERWKQTFYFGEVQGPPSPGRLGFHPGS